MSKELIIPVFIPHLGCPHLCVFCNQRKISGQERLPEIQSIEKQVREYRESCKDIDNREVQLAYYGGSFTAIDGEKQEEFLKLAYDLKNRGLIQKIRMSTRCDYLDDTVLARLKHYTVDIVELGVQSMDDEVLALSKRGHNAEQVRIAARTLKEQGIKLGLQMMIALPGDTPQKSLYTAREIVKLQPDFVRIYPTAIIKDTMLADMWHDGTYQAWEWDLLLNTTAEVAEVFKQADIPIIRIGLQAADNLSLDQDLLGGGYHPALGEMVKSRMMRKKIEKSLTSSPTECAYDISCNYRQVSQIRGQKNDNIRYFADKYKIRLYLKPTEELLWDQIIIEPKF